MRLTATLLTLASAISAAHAFCYAGGRSGNYGEWLKEKDITVDTERLSFACTNLIGQGYVKFGPFETRRTCMQQDLRTKWDFTIKSMVDPGGNGESNLSMEKCMEILGKEAYGCAYGGETVKEAWFASCMG
ncbi:uncharacterized protein GLRG_10267 [Colletotrichum graminicola M1.001]|uniref:Secreted protein n=1 Tax=Colletotrichum graminicola (strain M1.001 / M2 / FGSC 10212) TaxID=645133 RepID=E3QW89_COLGM|nr:uncharacterized protein GLRG_10267 [Colletotrichum graminicola M1.001]EFQ35123.1 hypothetical protein GLRG_10267 [Colletotrichum graminicola M1.001]